MRDSRCRESRAKPEAFAPRDPAPITVNLAVPSNNSASKRVTPLYSRLLSPCDNIALTPVPNLASRRLRSVARLRHEFANVKDARPTLSGTSSFATQRARDSLLGLVNRGRAALCARLCIAWGPPYREACESSSSCAANGGNHGQAPVKGWHAGSLAASRLAAGLGFSRRVCEHPVAKLVS